jgi:transposase
VDTSTLGSNASWGGVLVPRQRVPAPYPLEFRAEAIRLVRAGDRTLPEIADDLGVSAQSLRNWVKQADLDEGRREDGLTTDERAELARLRRENRVLREERDILKKAAAFFAKETRSTP